MNALKLKKLYAKTIKDSPYFCDSLLPSELSLVHPGTGEKKVYNVKEVAIVNRNAARHRVAKGIEAGDLMWNEILNENVWEATTHMAFNENAEAIDSLYDAMVTIMRTIDVLEGAQTLGKPDNKEKTDEK